MEDEEPYEGGILASGGEGDEWVLQSPIHVAAYTGDLASLEELLKTEAVDEVEENGRTPLMYSAMAGHDDCLKLLLKKHAHLSARDSNGQTALHWAAISVSNDVSFTQNDIGSLGCLKLLLAQMPNPAVKDNDGRTPLHLATNLGNSKCLAAIIRRLRPEDLNVADNEKMTALHWSAYNNSAENVRLLLKAGADIVLSDLDGKSAIHWTANNQDNSTVKTLLELAPTAVNLKDNEGRTTLHLAVAAGNVSIIETLCTMKGVKCDLDAVDMQFRSPLHWAAVLGLSEIMTLLLGYGANPTIADAVGATALHYAAQKNHVECVSILLSSPGVTDMPDSEGRTALMWAAQRGNYKVLEVMLQKEVDIHAFDNLGGTALHAASLSGHASCVQLLLQHGANANVVDSNGHTALFRACERGHTEVVVVLMHAEASWDLQDTSGRNCLHWAASGGHAAICSSLLHKGLPADSQDSGGRTALHCAAYGGFSECVSVLLEEGGATVNLQDHEGITALHWACSTGSLDVVQQLLINAGADPNLMEIDGGRLTPLDYAIIGGHQDVAQLLIENGALSISGIQELAAIVIQKVIRGYLVRKRYSGVLGGHKQEEEAALSPHKPVEADEISPGDSVPVTSTATQDAAVDSGHDRRRELQDRLAKTDQQMQKLQSWSLTQLKSVPSDIIAREKERVSLYRQKTKAALVIQLAWRRFIRRKRHRLAAEAEAKALQQGSLQWRRELAALIIQLAWRQYLRRKLLRQSLRRQRVLHDWTPSVLAARQRALVEKIYGQELTAVQYEPPKPKPMIRPAYLYFMPSPAAMSFNFAVQSYQPSGSHPPSHDHTQSGTFYRSLASTY